MDGGDIAGMEIWMGSGGCGGGGVADVDETVDRNVSSVEDMDRGWRYDTYFEMGVDLEVGDTAIYPLPTMIVFF